MEKQEKKTKVSGVYLVLAALTVLFAVKGIGEAKLEGFRAEITFTEEDGDENSGG